MLYSQGVPRMELNVAGRSITINSTIFLTCLAVTASLIGPMSGVRSCLSRALVIPILLKVLQNRTSAELPVSIMIRESSHPPTSSLMTRASS